MHQPSQLILLVLLLGTGSSQALSDEDKKTLLELHNLHRSKVTPPAADMLKMYWDPDLEKLAKSYAAQCIWDHNPNRGNTGENLYITSAPTVDMKSAMDLWHEEEKDYDFSTLACTKGKMCGHYTQVVWATSNKIGCGEQFCEKVKNQERQRQTLLVCNYKPPGNFRGKKPYSEGVSCSKCPAEYKCINNLCALEETPSLAADPSVGWSAAPHSTTTAAPSIELDETSATPTTATSRQPSSPELRTSPEVDLELEDFSVASVTPEGVPSSQKPSTRSLTSSPGVDRDVQETTTPLFTSTDPSSLHSHLFSTNVEEEKEDTTLRAAEHMSPQTWPSSQSLVAKDLDVALEDASATSTIPPRNLSPKLTPSLRIITSPTGAIGLEENYQSAITPEPTLTPATSPLLHIVTAVGGHALPFRSNSVDTTEPNAGNNFPGSLYLCLFSAIFLLELFF